MSAIVLWDGGAVTNLRSVPRLRQPFGLPSLEPGPRQMRDRPGGGFGDTLRWSRCGDSRDNRPGRGRGEEAAREEIRWTQVHLHMRGVQH